MRLQTVTHTVTKVNGKIEIGMVWLKKSDRESYNKAGILSRLKQARRMLLES